MTDVIDRILARPELLKDAYPVISADELLQTEETIGFPLPQLLRDLYLRVGNGGFGPYFGGFHGGLNGYEPGETIVSLYTNFCSEPGRFLWPDRMLPFFHWGCACRCCLDCTSEGGVVIYFDPSEFKDHYRPGERKDGFDPYITEPVKAFRKDASSLEEWLERWLAGTARMGRDKPKWRPKGWQFVKPPRRPESEDQQFKLDF